MLSVERLCIELPGPDGPRPVVRGVTVRVAREETVGLVGRSGSGKTMTALAVLGLLPREARVSGRILFTGQDLLGLPEPRLRQIRGRRIAAVFQEPHAALNPVRPVGRQIGEVLRVRGGLSRAAARRRRVELLEAVGIERAGERQFSYPHELSGGQAQRVMIAMALAVTPELLIADEPTTALDAATGRQVMDLLIALKREHRFGLVLISHDDQLVTRVADRVVVLEAGQSSPRRRVPARPRYAPPVASRGAAEVAGPPLLEVRELTVRYSNRYRRRGALALAAVDRVSLTVADNEVVALVGQSGCGKTTLARSIVGLTQPAEGDIRYQGRTCRGPARGAGRSAPIQMVFQDPYTTLNPRRSVGESLAEALACGGRDRGRPEVEALLAKVELDAEMSERFPHELSGGERQRVAIARALAVGPRLLVLDEPMSSLDYPVRIRLLDLLERLRQADGLTMLLISHDMELVEAWAHRIVRMQRGRLVDTYPGAS